MAAFAGPQKVVPPDARTDAPGRMSKRVRIGYATGSLVTGAFGTVPGLLLPPFLTSTVGVSAFLAGLVVLLPKAWDVLVNPLAGRLSDRTNTRWGARRPYLLVGGLALAVLFASIFAGVGTGRAGALWVALTFLATATAFAFFQVPYVAMPADMTESAGIGDPYGERTRMMTWRVAFLALTILVSGACAPLVRDRFGGGMPGHRAMGVFIALMIVAGTLSVFYFTKDAPQGVVVAGEPTLRAQLQVARQNKPFRMLVLCFVVQAVGVGAMLAGVQYFADHVLHNHGATTYLFGFVVGPAILVMPVWNRIGARMGKLRGYVVASLTIASGTTALVASPLLPHIAVYGIVALIGVGYAGQQLFGLAMLPDCIAYDTLRTGKRQAGVFTGLWTAGETLGLAIGPYLFLQTIGLFGYASSTTGHPAAQTPTAELGVLLGFSVLPGVVVGLALLFLRTYNLSTDRLADVAGMAPMPPASVD